MKKLIGFMVLITVSFFCYEMLLTSGDPLKAFEHSYFFCLGAGLWNWTR